MSSPSKKAEKHCAWHRSVSQLSIVGSLGLNHSPLQAQLNSNTAIMKREPNEVHVKREREEDGVRIPGGRPSKKQYREVGGVVELSDED